MEDAPKRMSMALPAMTLREREGPLTSELVLEPARFGQLRVVLRRGALVALSRHLAVPGPVVESLRYDLDEATVFHPSPSPVPDAAPAVLIELRRSAGAGPLPEALARRLLPRHSGRDAVTLLTPQRDSDRLLLAALQAGWSVVSVTDAAGRRDGGPA